MNYRIERLNGDMQRVLADIIEHRIKDPRKTQLVGVTKVDIAKDLKTAKVYLSVLGDKDSALTTFNTVVRSTGFIKSELAVSRHSSNTRYSLYFGQYFRVRRKNRQNFEGNPAR